MNDDGKVLNYLGGGYNISFSGVSNYLISNEMIVIKPCEKYSHKKRIYKVSGKLNDVNTINFKLNSNNYDTLYTHITDTVNILKIKALLTTGIKGKQWIKSKTCGEI